MLMMGNNIDTIDTNKDVGLRINSEKTYIILLSHHQNSRQSCDMNVANSSFENVAQFKYLFKTYQNFIREENERR
jgi:hypothetical protein